MLQLSNNQRIWNGHSWYSWAFSWEGWQGLEVHFPLLTFWSCFSIHFLSSGWEGAKELGGSIFPIYSLFNGEPRSYLEFPNHLIVFFRCENDDISPFLAGTVNRRKVENIVFFHSYIMATFYLTCKFVSKHISVLICTYIITYHITICSYIFHLLTHTHTHKHHHFCFVATTAYRAAHYDGVQKGLCCGEEGHQGGARREFLKFTVGQFSEG